MIVILDTNSIYEDFFLKSAGINKLISVARTGGHKIFIPEVVVLEMVKHYRESLEGIAAILQKQFARLHRKTDIKAENPVTDAKVKQSVREYRAKFNEELKLLGISILPLPAAPHEEMIERCMRREKPFKESGVGYADALIWLSILNKASYFSGSKMFGGPRILFVTNNSSDFCKTGNWELHIDLQDELEMHEIPSGVIKVVKGLDDASSLLYEDTDEVRTVAIWKYLQSPDFETSDFIEIIKERIELSLAYRPFSSEVLGFGPALEDPVVEQIYPDFHFELHSVESLDEGKVSICFDVSVTCLFDVYVFKSDLSQVNRAKLSIYDYDWNNYYVAAQIEHNAWFTVAIIADQELRSIDNLDIEVNVSRNKPEQITINRRSDL